MSKLDGAIENNEWEDALDDAIENNEWDDALNALQSIKDYQMRQRSSSYYLSARSIKKIKEEISQGTPGAYNLMENILTNDVWVRKLSKRNFKRGSDKTKVNCILCGQEDETISWSDESMGLPGHQKVNDLLWLYKFQQEYLELDNIKRPKYESLVSKQQILNIQLVKLREQLKNNEMEIQKLTPFINNIDKGVTPNHANNHFKIDLRYDLHNLYKKYNPLNEEQKKQISYLEQEINDLNNKIKAEQVAVTKIQLAFKCSQAREKCSQAREQRAIATKEKAEKQRKNMHQRNIALMFSMASDPLSVEKAAKSIPIAGVPITEEEFNMLPTNQRGQARVLSTVIGGSIHRPLQKPKRVTV